MLKDVPIVGVLSFIFPSLGRGLSGVAPVIAYWNSIPREKRMISIGDEVKVMIQKGKTKPEIIDYIRNYKL